MIRTMTNKLKDNGTVLVNEKICEGAELYNMIIEAPEIAKWAMPGQIVHILCGEGTTLRRPISICETMNDCIRICYEVRGKGTDWMAKRKEGDKISVLGALGHGFSHKEGERAVLVGGGIGIYPLLSIGKKCKGAKALFGFRNASLINSLELFENNGIETKVITDDGSNGRKGFVTELRAAMPHTFFLIPGYGAQGGAANDIVGAFDNNKSGAIVNSSRALMCAYKKAGDDGRNFKTCTRDAVIAMRDDINSVL